MQMLSHLALTGALATLLSSTSAAPLNSLARRQAASNGGQTIQWLSESGEQICLQVNNGVLENGQSVGAGPCSDEVSVFQSWIYTPGSTTIQVAPNNLTETPFCIDFGTNLGSNGQYAKIWQCYEGLAAQSLYITDDNHIAVENGPGQCLDVQAESSSDTSGPYPITKRLQTWDCTFGNTNQIFGFNETPGPIPGPTPPPTGPARQIRWLKTTPEEPGQAGPGEKCLQVNSPGFSTRTIGIGGCFNVGPGETNGSGGPGDAQLFYYNLGATKIQMFDTASDEVFCVDFGSNPANGGRISIAACDDNAPGQRLYITDDHHIAVENGPGQCMDVQAESGIQNVRPYGILKSIQSWQCSFGNENQIFIFPDA
ncbi:hypothetical protein NliqN6_0958 [Naganishia liquefaciens]|uniref:Ricin B lectin domain-containing protein n=1 Tax=Naganishia liquefaciens TaxID=104408 RepID=A0A8H3TNS2_9TREE|nr:hypothetical protein NliqN6_0958 [Naganishia liquefaciens]